MTAHQRVVRVRDLTWLEKCERHIWLNTHGDPAAQVRPGLTQERRAAQGRQHERAILPVPDHAIRGTGWHDQVQHTLTALRAGVPSVQHAAFSVRFSDTVTLVGEVDHLVRVAGDSHFGDWYYEPVEVKQIGKALPAHCLQLQCYRWMLERIQGVLPTGHLWLGEDRREEARRPHRVESLTGPVQDVVAEAVQRFVRITQYPTAPPIWFARKICPYCPWRQSCEQTALATQDCALLPGLRVDTATALRHANITTLPALVALTPEQLAAYRGVGRQGPTLLAHARAITTGQPVRLSDAPAPPPAQVALYLDLETYEHPERVWAFGFATGPNDTRIVLVVPEPVPLPATPMVIADVTITCVRDMAAGWQVVADTALPSTGPILHWGHHEQRFLRATAPPEIRMRLETRMVDLQDWITTHYALPVTRRATALRCRLFIVGTRFCASAARPNAEHTALERQRLPLPLTAFQRDPAKKSTLERRATGDGGYSAKSLSVRVGVTRPDDDSFTAAETAFDQWCRARQGVRECPAYPPSRWRHWVRKLVGATSSTVRLHAKNRALLTPVVTYVQADVQFLVSMRAWIGTGDTDCKLILGV
jgi:uncharacterized protein